MTKPVRKLVPLMVPLTIDNVKTLKPILCKTIDVETMIHIVSTKKPVYVI